ncbi:MAG: DegT/DnrJ/EryC1/StrS family aminotransferase [Chloroflexota bacterium]
MAYKVPFVNVPAHYGSMREEVLKAVDDSLSRGDVIMRSDMHEFESAIASMVGTRYAVGVNSGFDALHHSVRAAELGPRDEVITVAHTFVATVAAIVHCGATPVLVDVGEDFNIVMDELEQAITERTRAVIPVHLNGRLCDMERLMAIARAHNLIVIEDAAQALGATFDGQMAGSFGLTGCFSLYPFKMLGAFGDGGIVTTNDADIADRITSLRDHGQDRNTGDIRFYGFNTRLDNLHAAILNVKLRYFPGWIQRRREIADAYWSGLSEVPFIKVPHFHDPRYYDVYQNYVIRAERRDALVEHLRNKDIEVLISWEKPMHHHQALGLGHFSLPETEKLCGEVLSLPMHPDLSDEQVEYVIEAVRSFY